MRSFFLVSSVLLGLAAAFSKPLRGENFNYNITQIFEPCLSPGAEIYYPSDANYSDEVVPRVSTFDPPSFIATILPDTVEDVQNIIREANRYNLPFFATGGGHGVEPGFANVVDAVNIQLNKFNTTSLDADANTLTIGPGADFVATYDILYDAGKQVPVGNSPCVNMIGATIGAGVGPLLGQYGLIMDSLLSVDLVTAKGHLVTASETENSDLFWAVRGAGANFGIIVSATYRVYDAPNDGQMIVADFDFPASANVSVWELLALWDSDDVFPSAMGMSVAGLYNRTSNTPYIGASMSFIGTQDQAQPYIDKLVALDPTLWRNVSIGWNLLTRTQGFGVGESACVRGIYGNHYSLGTNYTNVTTYTDVYNKHVAFVEANSWYNGQVVFQRYGAATALSLPVDQRGVYPWRDIKTLVNINNFYDSSEHDDDVFAYGQARREELQATSGFDSLQVYINYGFGDEGPEVWYGADNLPRLSALKRKWDPLNQFGPGNPVPL